MDTDAIDNYVSSLSLQNLNTYSFERFVKELQDVFIKGKKFELNIKPGYCRTTQNSFDRGLIYLDWKPSRFLTVSEVSPTANGKVTVKFREIWDQDFAVGSRVNPIQYAFDNKSGLYIKDTIIEGTQKYPSERLYLR